MKFTLGRGTIELAFENVQDEIWLEDFVEKRRKAEGFDPLTDTMEIETKDNNGFRKLDHDIASSNIRKVKLLSDKKK